MTREVNVKNFGAVGDGVADDWSAIMRAVNWTTSANRGLIYFPAGTYKVSQPINFYDGGTGVDIVNIIFRGEIGLSTVVGNFSDYVFRREGPDTAGDSGIHGVDTLAVTNTHATGGGIRMGYCVGAYVRDCVVTANRGINTATDDIHGDVTSQEVVIENCTLSPGSNPSGSLGVMSVSDGPIINCSIIGFSKGVIGWGQQGGQTVMGCHIELCGIGVHNGANPAGDAFNPSMKVSGCHIKNCGTGIKNDYSIEISGVRIEAAEGTISGDPQYGFIQNGGSSIISGLLVTGQYAQYGISVPSGGFALARNFFYGVQAFNTSSLTRPAWSPVPNASRALFRNCNIPAIYTMQQLPAFPIVINTISWSGGTTTANLFGNIGAIAAPFQITVTGVTPSGYNGTFTALTSSGNTITYAQSDPGSPTGSGGTVVVLPPDSTFTGDCYNVSDGDVSAWGANPVGGGSTHAKVRWNGSTWTVVGK